MTNTITYNAAITACAKRGEWQRALGLMEDMRGKGVPANTTTCSAAISAYQKVRQWQRELPGTDMISGFFLPISQNVTPK